MAGAAPALAESTANAEHAGEPPPQTLRRLSLGHMAREGVGRSSNMRLPSCGSISSPRLASPLPALPYSPGSNASGFAAAALLAPPASSMPAAPSACNQQSSPSFVRIDLCAFDLQRRFLPRRCHESASAKGPVEVNKMSRRDSPLQQEKPAHNEFSQKAAPLI